MDLVVLPGEAELGEELLAVEELAVGGGGGGGEVAAVAAHHLVDDEHARVGALLADDVREEARALLGRGPGAEGLLDRVDVVVDRLREAHHDQLVVVLREVGREVGRGRVRVVAANRVQHVHAVLHELVGRDLLRILALLHEPALHAVLDVRELHAGVADRRAAERVERGDVLADRGRDLDGPALQQPLVAGDVADDLDLRVDLRVLLDEGGDGGGEARGEAAGGEDGDFADFLGFHFGVGVEGCSDGRGVYAHARGFASAALSFWGGLWYSPAP